MRDPLPERLPDDEMEEIMKLLAEPGGLLDEPAEAPAAESGTPEADAAAEAAPEKPKTPKTPKTSETPEPPETFEFTFGADFQEHFAPSEDYLLSGEDSGGEEYHFPEPRERRNLLKEVFLQLRKQQEAAPALPPAKAQERVRAYAVNLRLRALLAFALTLPLILISVAQTWGILPGFLSYTGDGKPYLALFFMVLLQLLVMLCGIDVLGRGLNDLVRLKPGAETLLVFACFSSFLYVGSIVLRSATEGAMLYEAVGFLPYSAIVAVSVAFALWGYAHRYGSYARTYKILAAVEDKCDCVVSEESLWGGMSGFSRHTALPEDFIPRTEAPDIVSRVMRFFSPLLIVASIVLAVLSASYHSEGQYFFWALSAFTAACVPITTFCSYPLVFTRISARLAHMGAAINGWSGAVDAARADVIVIEDDDLFPAGTLTLNGLKILGDHSFGEIISFSGSLLHASGSGLFKALESVVRDHGGALRPVSGLELFEGGMSGSIGSDRVMMGTLNFMHSMGIQVPPELSSKSAVFTSVNHDLAGVLAISYAPSTHVKGALLLLEDRKMTNILAVRDVNISLNLLRDKFGVDPDLLEYPVVEERVQLSDPKRPYHGKVTAVLARDGLCPYAEAIIGGQRLHRFTIINLCVHLISLLVGLFVVFYFTGQTEPVTAASISPANLLVFMFIWWAAQWLVSCFSHRY